jgi:hypothetical protein
MLYTLPQAEQAAHIPAYLTEIPFSLSSKALMLFGVLYGVAAKVAEHRGYSQGVSTVHFFVPCEIVAHACGMARSTLYLKLAELKACGLAEARAHYVTHKGRTRSDGSVFAVKTRNFEGQPAKVPFDALKKSYRCLSADIEAGRTAWAQIGQSKNSPREQDAIKEILAWALPPSTTQRPDKGLTVRSDLEALLDVPFVDKTERRAAVDGAARALSASLADAGGLMFYRWLIWQLLRLSDRHQGDYWHQVYEMARRARADAAEGFARKPGALFTSRLKQWEVWEQLRRLPPYAVGPAPKSN